MDIELQPLTQQQQNDINDTIEENPDEYMPEEDESPESFFNFIKGKFGRGFRYAIAYINDRFKLSNQGKNIPQYMELQNLISEEEKENEYAGSLLERIRKLYPKFTYDGDNENFFNNFRVNDNNVLEVKPINSTKWYQLTSDENGIPKSLKNKLGFSQEHIDRFNNIKEEYINQWFLEPKNLTLENGFDLHITKDEMIQIKDSQSKNPTFRNLYSFNTNKFYMKGTTGVPQFTERTYLALGELKSDALEKLETKNNEIKKKLLKAREGIRKARENAKKAKENVEEAKKKEFELKQLEDLIEEQEENIKKNNKMDSILQEEIDKRTNEVQLFTQEQLQSQRQILQNEATQHQEEATNYENEAELQQEEVNRLEQQSENLENQREAIEETLSLRDRIKQIIKRHGLTVTGIALSVGVIIGVIVNSLKNGLTSVANATGNALKTLGQKLGQILPGMIGAIASFIFRTAGQVVGFLAKNAWLLILAVVMYVVERYKK